MSSKVSVESTHPDSRCGQGWVASLARIVLDGALGKLSKGREAVADIKGHMRMGTWPPAHEGLSRAGAREYQVESP